MVSGDLPDQSSQDGLVRAGSEAVPGRQLSHGMAHSAQADGSDV